MKCFVEFASKKYNIDFSKGLDISISLNFNGNQPNTYNVDKATSVEYRDGQFIGDTRKGGPCNFETYTFTPHCNGTHTECIGHITKERVSIRECLKEEIIPTTVISVTPKKCTESYIPNINEDDLIISKQDLQEQLKKVETCFLKALVVRTLPNNEDKKTRDYMMKKPAFFSVEAMSYIVSLGVVQLLVDTPSVDRLFDEGHLIAHNIFWETKAKEFNFKSKNKTITEMIFVEDSIEDGKYLLNLQVPAFVSDAAPSRPILYKLYAF